MRRKGTAFTIIELLVVVGIISVLISILLPTLSRTRAKANQLACLSNLRQLGIGMILYCQDNKGWFPRAAPYATPAQPESTQDFLWWQQASQDLFAAPNRDIFSSSILKYLGVPSDRRAVATIVDFTERRQQILRCPSDILSDRSKVTSNGKYFYSYSLNNLMQSLDPSIRQDALAVPSNSVTGKQFVVAGKLCRVHDASLKILFVEESPTTLDDGSFDPTEQTTWEIKGLLSVRHDPLAQLPEASASFAKIGNLWTIRNANRRGNVTFCDGHADYVLRSYVNDPNSKITGDFEALDPYH